MPGKYAGWSQIEREKRRRKDDHSELGEEKVLYGRESYGIGRPCTRIVVGGAERRIGEKKWQNPRRKEGISSP